MRRYRYDAALSFAGSERPLASFLASLLEVNGVRVYYDDFEQWRHLGRNLVEELSDIYENQCRFCIMLISRQYLKGPFPILERRSALDRMMLAPKHGYILPIQVDGSWIKGLPRATCFVDLRQRSLVVAGEMLVRKIVGSLPKEGLHLPMSPELADVDLRDEEERRRFRNVYDINRSFQKIKGYLLSESGEAVKWVSRATVAHYGYLKRHALLSGREVLRDLHFVDRLIALRLRVEISPRHLSKMDEAEIFLWGVRKGLVNKESIAQGEIRSVALLGEHLASAIVVRGEEKTGSAVSRLRFMRDDGRWCLDLLDALRHANLYFESVKEDWSPEIEDYFLLETLSKLCGRRISESVWMLPTEVPTEVPEGARSAFTSKREICSAWSPSAMPSRTPDLQILIRQSGSLSLTKLSFEVRASDPSLSINFLEFGPVSLKMDPGVYAQTWANDIKTLTESQAVAEHRLAGKGATMFKELLPSGLQKLLWSLQGKISTIQILSDEPHIPWEVLKLRIKEEEQWKEGPYLCEAFAVTRWLRGVPEILELPMRDIALVIPKHSQLPNALEEKAELLALATHNRKVSEIEAQFCAVMEAFAKGLYDAWHFSGHGRDNGSDPNCWEICLDDQNALRPEDLNAGQSNMGVTHPLVFLNACHSGKAGFSLAGAGGWSKQLLDLGVGAFIGTHWVVEDQAAKEFALAFYRYFFSGSPIAEAVRKARSYLHEHFPGDATWLAYTVFAHPEASVQR